MLPVEEKWMSMGPPGGIGRAWDSWRLRSQRDADEYVDEMQSRHRGPRGSWREIGVVVGLFVAVLAIGAVVRLLL